MKKKFRLGLIINPLAGLGGSVALKGSDDVAQQALALGAEPKAQERMQLALEALLPFVPDIDIITGAGVLGEQLARSMGFATEVIYAATVNPTGSTDTQALASLMLEQQNIDLLLFAGGDGTARDICQIIDEQIPVLGVPAGVKIHSGIFAITPSAAGALVVMLLTGKLVSLMSADVMDLDETAYKAEQVKVRYFGQMQVPAEPRYIQAVKMAGCEVEALVLADIAADIVEQMQDELYIMGSGSTVAAIMQEMHLPNTLLGVDLVQHQQLIANDLTADQLLQQTQGKSVKLVITLIGGQGHILGRGNQQLSPALIRKIGKNNILIVATKTKLKALAGKSLIVDSGDPKLDKELCGFYRITTGYHDYVMYPVANPDLQHD